MRFTAEENEVINKCFNIPEVKHTVRPSLRVQMKDGKYRFPDGVVKGAAITLQEAVFTELGLDKADNEDEMTYSERLWARAIDPSCKVFAAFEDEIPEEYEDRFRNLGDVSPLHGVHG